MSDEKRPRLRDCPLCKASGENDEKVYLTKEVGIAHECEWTIGYTVRCVDCGVSISDEHMDEVVRIWNGEPVPSDEEEA